MSLIHQCPQRCPSKIPKIYMFPFQPHLINSAVALLQVRASCVYLPHQSRELRDFTFAYSIRYQLLPLTEQQQHLPSGQAPLTSCQLEDRHWVINHPDAPPDEVRWTSSSWCSRSQHGQAAEGRSTCAQQSFYLSLCGRSYITFLYPAVSISQLSVPLHAQETKRDCSHSQNDPCFWPCAFMLMGVHAATDSSSVNLLVCAAAGARGGRDRMDVHAASDSVSVTL